jgi:hypothetical protein
MKTLKNVLFLLFTILIIANLVNAVEIETNKDEYSFDQTVEISVTDCARTSLLLMSNIYTDLIVVEQGYGSWDTYYNTNSDPYSGTYNIEVKCGDGSSSEVNICVNSPGCSTEVEITAEPAVTIVEPINYSYDYFEEEFDNYSEIYDGYKEGYLELKDVKTEEEEEEEEESNTEDNVTETDEEDEEEEDEEEKTFEDYEDGLKDLKDDLKSLKNQAKDYLNPLKQESPKNETLIDNLEDLITEITKLRTELIDFLNENKKVSLTKIIKTSTCKPNLICTSWSYCNKELKQTKTCTDKNKCLATKTETQDCQECVEDWVCGKWSECKNDKQTRTCVDQHFCDTTALKPKIEKTCEEEDSSMFKDEDQLNLGSEDQDSETNLEPELKVEDSTTSGDWTGSVSIWDGIKLPLIIIGSLILLIVIGVLVYFLVIQPHKNKPSKIKDYVEKEKNKGISNQKIKETLLSSGWQEKDINKALK